MIKKLPIEGMSCAHCKNNIETAVKVLEGVNQVNADFREGYVLVDYDEAQLALDTIIKEIEDLGYEVML